MDTIKIDIRLLDAIFRYLGTKPAQEVEGLRAAINTAVDAHRKGAADAGEPGEEPEQSGS